MPFVPYDMIVICGSKDSGEGDRKNKRGGISDAPSFCDPPVPADKELGFYRKCPHERKPVKPKMLAGTFDRILLNEADGACGGRGELRKTMGFQCPFS
jgi:hypothetical protein